MGEGGTDRQGRLEGYLTNISPDIRDEVPVRST